MRCFSKVCAVVLVLAFPSLACAGHNNFWQGLAGDGLWSNDGNWQNAGGAPHNDGFVDNGLEPGADLPTSVVLGGGGSVGANIIIDTHSQNTIVLGPGFSWQGPYSATVSVPVGETLTLTGTFLMATNNTLEDPPATFLLAGSNLVANFDGTVDAGRLAFVKEGGNWVNIGGSVTVGSVVDDPNTDTWATVGNGLAMTGGTLTITGDLVSFFDDLNGSGFLVATNGDYDAVYDGMVTTVTGSGEGFGIVPEPATIALLGLGVVGLLSTRRRRNV